MHSRLGEEDVDEEEEEQEELEEEEELPSSNRGILVWRHTAWQSSERYSDRKNWRGRRIVGVRNRRLMQNPENETLP